MCSKSCLGFLGPKLWLCHGPFSLRQQLSRIPSTGKKDDVTERKQGYKFYLLRWGVAVLSYIGSSARSAIDRRPRRPPPRPSVLKSEQAAWITLVQRRCVRVFANVCNSTDAERGVGPI
jgi:hypothetical protein